MLLTLPARPSNAAATSAIVLGEGGAALPLRWQSRSQLSLRILHKLTLTTTRAPLTGAALQPKALRVVLVAKAIGIARR
jgi:hypothetical protein